MLCIRENWWNVVALIYLVVSYCHIAGCVCACVCAHCFRNRVCHKKKSDWRKTGTAFLPVQLQAGATSRAAPVCNASNMQVVSRFFLSHSYWGALFPKVRNTVHYIRQIWRLESRYGDGKKEKKIWHHVCWTQHRMHETRNLICDTEFFPNVAGEDRLRCSVAP